MSKGECSCQVEYINGEPVIGYCPKHKAAPELYEACKLLIERAKEHGNYSIWLELPIVHIEQALAEGGE